MKKQEVILLEKDVVLPSKETIEVYNIGTAEIPIYIVTEHTVRRELSTHKICEGCGEVLEKRTYCQTCSSKKSAENYFKKTFKEWDGETPLVIYNDDTYFFDEESLQDYIEENGDENLELVICEPNYCPELTEEYFSEEYLPENYDGLDDFDKGLVQKIKELNEYIKTLGPMSWSGGRFRTEYKTQK